MLGRRSPPLLRAFPAGACRVCVASRHRQPFAAHRLGRAPSLCSALRCQSSGASKSDIDTAYQHLAADAKGKLKLQLLSDAHAVLSNELKRKEYDAMCQKSDVRSLTVISDAKSAKANPQNSTNATKKKKNAMRQRDDIRALTDKLAAKSADQEKSQRSAWYDLSEMIATILLFLLALVIFQIVVCSPGLQSPSATASSDVFAIQ